MTIAADLAEPPRPRAVARPLLDEGRSLLRLAAPIMLICLVNMGMSVTDTAMVSALFGAEALAAVAVGSDLYSIVFYLGAGVLAGFAPLYTAAVVRADLAERARLERSGRLAVALIAALLAPWCGPHPTGSPASVSIATCCRRARGTRARWRRRSCRCSASLSTARS